MTPARRAGIAVIFLWFFIGRIAHFVFTEAEMRIVPLWALWLRLPIQVALLALIAWTTLRPGPRNSRARG